MKCMRVTFVYLIYMCFRCDCIGACIHDIFVVEMAQVVATAAMYLHFSQHFHSERLLNQIDRVIVDQKQFE